MMWAAPVGSVLGQDRLPVHELLAERELERPGISKRVGFESVYRDSRFGSPAELAASMFSDIQAEKLRQLVDTLIFVSSSEETITPGGGFFLQNRLGLSARVQVININDACTGFITALDLAGSLLASGQSNAALVVTADRYSQFFNETDVDVAPLFSDGSAAFLVSAERHEGFDSRPIRLLAAENYSDGGLAHLLQIKNNTSGEFIENRLLMSGSEVYSFVVGNLSSVLSQLSDRTSASVDSGISWFVHQGSRVVVEAVSRLLGADASLLFRAGSYGNVVASSLPFQLEKAWPELGGSSRLGLLAFGVGMSISGRVYEIGEA